MIYSKGHFFKKNQTEWTRCWPAILELSMPQLELMILLCCFCVFCYMPECVWFFSIPYVIDCLVYYIIIIHFEFRVQDMCMIGVFTFCFNMVKKKSYQNKNGTCLKSCTFFKHIYLKVFIIRYTRTLDTCCTRLTMKAHSHKQCNIPHD